MPVDTEALQAAVTATLLRAVGQRGRAALDIRLSPADGELGNQGTLFEVGWSISVDGQLNLILFVDGVAWWEGSDGN